MNKMSISWGTRPGDTAENAIVMDVNLYAVTIDASGTTQAVIDITSLFDGHLAATQPYDKVPKVTYGPFTFMNIQRELYGPDFDTPFVMLRNPNYTSSEYIVTITHTDRTGTRKTEQQDFMRYAIAIGDVIKFEVPAEQRTMYIGVDVKPAVWLDE